MAWWVIKKLKLHHTSRSVLADVDSPSNYYSSWLNQTPLPRPFWLRSNPTRSEHHTWLAFFSPPESNGWIRPNHFQGQGTCFFPLSSSKSPFTTNLTHLASFNYFLFSCCSASRSTIPGLRALTNPPALSHHLPWGIFPSRRVKLAPFFDLVALLSGSEWGLWRAALAFCRCWSFALSSRGSLEWSTNQIAPRRGFPVSFELKNLFFVCLFWGYSSCLRLDLNLEAFHSRTALLLAYLFLFFFCFRSFPETKLVTSTLPVRCDIMMIVLFLLFSVKLRVEAIFDWLTWSQIREYLELLHSSSW